MIKNRRPIKDARKRVLRKAEDRITEPDYEQSDEITRIGIVWAGLLDLDDILPPTTVAAMLAASELVQATSSTNSEEHWIGAASYAAMGAFSEVDDDDSEDGKLTTSKTQPMGFSMVEPPQE